ncbi:MAG: hypothetical protein K6A65_02630 [Succinivibrionaceae bacterium]|nr:hypothetical protein [Succinivibrionaceae bacterium]
MNTSHLTGKAVDVVIKALEAGATYFMRPPLGLGRTWGEGHNTGWDYAFPIVVTFCTDGGIGHEGHD